MVLMNWVLQPRLENIAFRRGDGRLRIPHPRPRIPSTPQSHIVYPTMTPTTSAAASTSPLRIPNLSTISPLLSHPCSPSRRERCSSTPHRHHLHGLPLRRPPHPSTLSSFPCCRRLLHSAERQVEDLAAATRARPAGYHGCQVKDPAGGLNKCGVRVCPLLFL